MEAEAILRGAQRFVVGERLTLERPEPDYPLRSCRGRLPRHGGGSEARFGIVVEYLIPVLLKQPATAKVSLDPPDRAFEHLGDFARPQVPEAAEDEFVIVLMPGVVEEDGVDLRVEAQVGAGALQDGDRAGLGASVAFLRCAARVEPRQHKDLWLIDLETGAERRLTSLPADFDVRDFDVSPDGRGVVLERVHEDSDVVLIDLAPVALRDPP